MDDALAWRIANEQEPFAEYMDPALYLNDKSKQIDSMQIETIDKLTQQKVTKFVEVNPHKKQAENIL